MTAIFISHSSADNDAAKEIKDWLKSQGHTSLFLDFDPEKGIKGGSDWEQTIYRQLRQCHAVIALLTPNWLASKWCFAELVQAREHGKAIFPVKVQPCEAGGVFDDIQHIDLTVDREEGYQRLRTGLLERGLDPLDVFDWNPKRPPYPGLLAFQEQDAAIFFGRGQEVLNILEALDALRRMGNEATRFALLLGASGSGKSSLVRAGILPRLKKQPGEWLPIPPFRPQLKPFDELALALATAFQAYGQSRDWRELRAELDTPAEQGRTPGQTLLTLVRDLSMAARQPDATVLITIDQAEELFGYTPPEEATRFLRLLRAGLESGGRRLMAITTMRSDFLGEFQDHSVLQDIEYPNHFHYRAMPVDPMPLNSFPEIIRGPAQLAGLRLDDGLVEAMVNDTGTRYALPLLAFTLRRLYERCGGDGRLTLDGYNSLGRLEGAIQGEAERILAEAKPTPNELDALHAAFVPTLVRINAEGGYARRQALIDDLPRSALPLLRRFVEAHLLITDLDTAGRETMEVAHEALLRTWSQLNVWLTEDQDKLRLLESLQRSASEWDQDGRRGDLLIHHNARLKDVETLVATPRFAVSENSVEKAYLTACSEVQKTREAAEKEEQERRIRDAERIAEEQQRRAEEKVKGNRKLRVALAGLGLTAIGLLAFGLYAWHQSKISLSRQLVAQSFLNTSGDLYHPLLLSLAALRAADTFETRDGMLRAIERVPRRLSFLWGHETSVLSIAFSPDGKTLASASEDNIVILWDVMTRKPICMPTVEHHDVEATNVAFSPDGKILAFLDRDESVILWDVVSCKSLGALLIGSEYEAAGVTSIVFISPDGKTLASGDKDGAVILWDVANHKPLGKALKEHKRSVRSLALSPDGKVLASASEDNTVVLWDVATRKPLGKLERHQGAVVTSVAFSPEGKTLASANDDNTIILWDVATRKPLDKLEGHQEGVTSVAFSPDGKTLASASEDNTIILWDVMKRTPLDEPLKGHQSSVRSVAFSPDGKTLASASEDNTIILWDVLQRKALGDALNEREKQHASRVGIIAFSPDGKILASGDWGGAGAVMLWDVMTRRPLGEPIKGHEGYVRSGAFSPDGKALALGEENTITLRDMPGRHYLGEPIEWRSRNSIISSVAFSPDGKILAFGNRDGTVILWDLASHTRLGDPLIGHQNIIQSVAFSPNGKALTSVSSGKMVVWDVASRKSEPIEIHHGYPMRFSPDGKTLASVNEDKFTVALWDVASRKPLGEPLEGQQSPTYSVAFSPDGRTLASGHKDGKVILWDVASRKPLGEPLEGQQSPIFSVAFSPDSSTLASGSREGAIFLWDADIKAWEKRACYIVNRNLTHQEWKDYVGDAMAYRPVCPDLPVPE